MPSDKEKVLLHRIAAGDQGAGVDAGVRQKLVTFLKNNAQSLWLKGTTRPGYFYGSHWTAAPSGETDLTTDLSGAMLMEGVALLKKNGLF